MQHHVASVDQFVTTLRSEGLARAWIVTDPENGAIRTSHRCMDELAGHIGEDRRDFHRHAGMFFEIGARSGLLLSAFVHRTGRGQAAGGVRYWAYRTLGELLTDGLRLSRGMGQKCALAGLWWGGGKGIIARASAIGSDDTNQRRQVFRDYGRFVAGLRGLYVTAEDVGTRPEDMAEIFRTTRFTTCIPPAYGGSGNPGVLTAQGVVVAMEAALDSTGTGSLAGKRIALQGLGNVSSHMIGMLLARDVASIVGADVSKQAVAAVREKYRDARVKVRVVEAGDATILAEQCDILAPNAVGGSLNPASIATLRAFLVCGAANNQLEDPKRDAALLRDAGIVYVPDFLANRMGIVNCANEQYGIVIDDPAIRRHLGRDWEAGVFRRCCRIIELAKANGTTTHDEAAALAEALQEELHPIWPGRGAEIIQSLTDSDWAVMRPE